MRRKALVVAVTATTFFGVAACGGGDSGGGGGSASSTEITGTGPITLVQGKDTSGFVQGVLDKWNKDHPDEKARLIELPQDADSQREKMIQNAQTESDAYDVLSTDVVWTSEFAANRVIVPLPEDEFPLDEMLEPVIETTKYLGKFYAAPSTSDGGMLFYRTDLLKAAGLEPPKTWPELIDACKKVQATPQGKGVGCYAGQFEKYEGLTVNASEVINGAGGEVTDDSGKPNVDTPEAAEGLDFLANGFKEGYIPEEAITYQEEEGRAAFQEGKLIFHRNWPYVYNLANGDEGTKVKGKFAVAPLPGLEGPGASSLGGHNFAISTYSKNKKSALEFIKFVTSEEQQKTNLELASQAPTFTSLYEDKALLKKYPYLPTLRDSINNAVPRPKVVRYGDASTAIQDAAYAALRGEMSSEDALKDLQSKLEEITKQ